MDTPLSFINLSVVRQLACFPFVVITSNSAMNTNVQFSVWTTAFNPAGYMPGSRTAHLYGNSVFNLLRNY